MTMRFLLILGLTAVGYTCLLSSRVAFAAEPNSVEVRVAPHLDNDNQLGIQVTCRIVIPFGAINGFDVPSVKLARALAADEEPRQYTEIGTIMRGGHTWAASTGAGIAWTRFEFADTLPPSGELLYQCTFDWASRGATFADNQSGTAVTDPVSAYLSSAPTAVPTGLRITDNHVANNQVILNWDAITGTPAELGHSRVTGYAIGRREAGRTNMRVLGSTARRSDTRYVDRGPVSGVVEYAVLPTTEYTDVFADWRTNLTEAQEWIPVEVKITPLDFRAGPTGLTIARVENNDHDWLLTWNQVRKDWRYRPFHVQVWQRVEGGEFAQIATVRGIPTERTYRVSAPEKGRRHDFHVIAARDAGDFDPSTSAPSRGVTFGTEVAPTVWEGDKGPGEVTIRWEPGRYNDNHTPADDIRWFVQYWPTAGPHADRRTTLREFGDANTRSVVLRHHEIQRTVGAPLNREFGVRIAAVNQAGVGAAAELTTSPIASNRAPQDPGKGTVHTQGSPSGRNINWWIEGPAVLSPGDRAVYTLLGEYADNNSGDPLSERDRYLIRPVGVREPIVNNRGVYDLTNDANGCHAVGTTDGHKVCLVTATEELSEDNVLTGPNLVQYQPPRMDTGGALAYRVDGNGVPVGHEMQVEIRDVAPISFFGETFQVGIGVRASGSSLLLEAHHSYLNVTVVRADPLPPAALHLSTATGDPTMWRLDWLPPANARVADVDAYRVYRRQHGTGEFAQPTDTEYTVLWAELPKPDEPTLEEFHVVAINAADARSAPSTVVRTGLPYPPRDVTVHVVATPQSAVVLSWLPASTPAATGATYRVETAAQEPGPWRVLTPPTTHTTRRYTATTVPPEETMYYRVRAVNPHGASAASAVVHAVLPGDPPRRLRTASTADGSSVTLSWLRPRGIPHTSVAGYRIERRAGGTTN